MPPLSENCICTDTVSFGSSFASVFCNWEQSSCRKLNVSASVFKELLLAGFVWTGGEFFPTFSDALSFASVFVFDVIDELPVEVPAFLPVSVFIFFLSFKEMVFCTTGYFASGFRLAAASVARVYLWGTG